MNESIRWALEHSIYMHTRIVESPAYTEEQRQTSREAIQACQERLREME